VIYVFEYINVYLYSLNKYINRWSSPELMRKKERVLVVVAHPDDETIWMGGALLKNKKKWDTTIMTLCRKTDQDRAPKFGKVCSIYGAKPIMSDYDDDKLDKRPQNEVKNRILKHCKGKFRHVFTHNNNGEYGHIRHKDVHNAVVSLVKAGKLSADTLHCFDYKKEGKICIAKRSADKFINHDGKTLRKKRSIIQDVYGFRRDIFETLCCRKAEGFKKFK